MPQQVVTIEFINHRFGVGHRCEFAVKIGKGNRLDLVRSVHDSIRTSAIEGCGGIGHEPRSKPEIARHSCRRRHTMIGGETGDHQRTATAPSQICFQGSANEATVDSLFDHLLMTQRHSAGFEVIAGLTGTQWRCGIAGHVSHVDQRGSQTAPRIEQFGDAILHLRVIAPTPARIVESILHVDDQQRGVRCENVHPDFPSFNETGKATIVRLHIVSVRLRCSKAAMFVIDRTDSRMAE